MSMAFLRFLIKPALTNAVSLHHHFDPELPASVVDSEVAHGVGHGVAVDVEVDAGLFAQQLGCLGHPAGVRVVGDHVDGVGHVQAVDLAPRNIHAEMETNGHLA